MASTPNYPNRLRKGLTPADSPSSEARNLIIAFSVGLLPIVSFAVVVQRNSSFGWVMGALLRPGPAPGVKETFAQGQYHCYPGF